MDTPKPLGRGLSGFIEAPSQRSSFSCLCSSRRSLRREFCWAPSPPARSAARNRSALTNRRSSPRSAQPRFSVERLLRHRQAGWPRRRQHQHRLHSQDTASRRRRGLPNQPNQPNQNQPDGDDDGGSGDNNDMQDFLNRFFGGGGNGGQAPPRWASARPSAPASSLTRAATSSPTTTSSTRPTTSTSSSPPTPPTKPIRAVPQP